MKYLGITTALLALITGIILFQSSNSVVAEEENYLAMGNAYFRSGQEAGASSAEEQIAAYQKALETYEVGIIERPEMIELKFNYEWVLRELEQEQEEQQEEDQEESEDQDGEDQEDQDESEGDSEGEDSQEEQEEEENQDEQEDEQEDSDGQEEEQEQQENEPQENEQSQEEAAINQILQMLEQQEEESLKNNQEVLVQGQGDGNDW